MQKREYFMRLALEQARLAAREGEVPVGCVVVHGDTVVAQAHNRRETDHDATAHAETLAIRAACRALGAWRLSDCALYVTLEPCLMCAGAILNARVGTVVYGARDREAGAMGGVLDVFQEDFPYAPRVYGGVLEDECTAILRDFFGNLRNKPASD